MHNFISSLPELIALVLGFALLLLRVKQRRTQEDLEALSEPVGLEEDLESDRAGANGPGSSRRVSGLGLAKRP